MPQSASRPYPFTESFRRIDNAPTIPCMCSTTCMVLYGRYILSFILSLSATLARSIPKQSQARDETAHNATIPYNTSVYQSQYSKKVSAQVDPIARENDARPMQSAQSAVTQSSTDPLTRSGDANLSINSSLHFDNLDDDDGEFGTLPTKATTASKQPTQVDDATDDGDVHGNHATLSSAKSIHYDDNDVDDDD